MLVAHTCNYSTGDVEVTGSLRLLVSKYNLICDSHRVVIPGLDLWPAHVYMDTLTHTCVPTH